MKNDSGINMINYGELQTYYPIRFDTKLSFDKLCEIIYSSSVIFKEEYQEKIIDSLGVSLAQFTEDYNNQQSDDSGMYLKMEDFDKYKSVSPSIKDISTQELRIEIDDTGATFNVSLVSVELEALVDRLSRIEDEYERSTNFYGDSFINSHERFLLLPLKIELSSEEEVWLFAILYVFSNKMGVLKLELPLVNVESYPLKRYASDEYISQVFCTWNDTFSTQNTLKDIARFYLNTLCETIKINFWQYDDKLQHIILIDFEKNPVHIENISDVLKEELFRIVCAPVPTRECTSYKKDAQEYIYKYSWGDHNVKYIIKNNGGCLSLVDESLLNYVSAQYKKSKKINVLDERDYYCLYDSLACDLQVNAELALIIIMLKRINNHNVIIQKQYSTKKSHEIQNEYWETIKYICDLQEGCYGTVNEQIDIFEELMPYYMKQQITNEKISAIDSIFKQKLQQRNDSFQNFISVGSLLLALFFGLPSIHDTIGILRDVCTFIPRNIPHISQDNVSVILWIVLNLCILIRLFVKK